MGDEEQTRQLTVVMTEIATKMQVLLDKQDELAENISKIKEAMYNPDAGIYERLKFVEESRRNSTRLVWFVFTVLVGSLVASLVKILTS